MADIDLSPIKLQYDTEAERSVLGAVLGDAGILPDIIATLHPEHFYVDVNRGVYEVMSAMYMASETIDILTVREACVRRGVFESNAEATNYLTSVMNEVPSIGAAVKYAHIVTEKYLLRRLVLAAREITDAAGNSEEPADRIVDFAEQKIFDIREGVENKSLVPIRGIIYDRVLALDELIKQSAENGGAPVMTGLPSGYSELDKMISGLNRSDLIILAARPGMGKTSFAMNMAVNVAKKCRDKQICVFSLEMSKEQIVSRMLSGESGVPFGSITTGRLTQNQISAFMTAANVLQNMEIYIDDTPACNVMNIKSKLRRMKNVGVVIIDYLQLMSSSANYNGNRVLEVSEITRNLKIMAKELNVPVIALSQLARGPEARVDKRPLLSDLRDSGSIEQDADIVLFLYRNSYYDKTDPNQNVCECLVSKNRHGEIGTVYLGWQGECTRFTNMEYRLQSADGS